MRELNWREITSRDNPHFKALKKLASSARERRKCQQTLLEGMHLLTAYCAAEGRAGQMPQEVIVSARGLQKPEIADWLQAHTDVKTLMLPDALHDELAATETPSGVLACIATPEPESAPLLTVNTLILDGIQDPGNVGTLLRTAAAAGFRQVLLSEDCAAVWSPKVLRSGQGAHFVLDCHEGVDLAVFMTRFQGTTLVTALDGAISLYEAQWETPVAWVLGSEGQGVRPALQQLARQRIKIPMPGQVESLNVGAAAAVCLFETLRRQLRRQL